MRSVKFSLLAATLAALTACGGGGGGGTSTDTTNSSVTLEGVAATGAAIQLGTVSVKCKVGSGTTTTDSSGAYTVTLDGGELPCILKVTDPITNSDFYSVAETGATRANITPLTQLVAANVLGDSPSVAFASFDAAAQNKISRTSLASAQAVIQAATAAIGSDTDMSSIDLLKDVFRPAIGSTVGDTTDQKIDALMTALAASNKRISDLETQLLSASNATAAASGITTLIGSAKDSLTNCPSARSTTVWVMDMLGTAPTQYAVDFSAMTMTRIADNRSFSIAAKLDSNNQPINCAFTSTINGTNYEYRVARGGNVVWKSSNNFGLAAPAQTSWSLNQSAIAGTYPTLAFVARKGNTSTRVGFPMKIVINTDGTVDAFTCDLTKTLPDCKTTASDSPDKNTCTKLQNGSFTCTSSLGTTSVGVVYVNGSQVTLYMTITDMVSNGYHWGGIAVSTKAVAMRLPSAGDTIAAGSSWFAGIDPGSNQVLTGLTYASTVESVDAATNSFVTSVSGTTRTYQRYINTPSTGLGYSVTSTAKGITLHGSGGWYLAISKNSDSTLWDGWYAYANTQ